MTPVTVLGELLDRLAVAKGGRILLSRRDLDQWPKEAVDAMKRQRLLIRVTPAKSAICDGCEDHCCLPVHTITSDTNGKQMSFVVCEDRDDINRVPIAPSKLEQWKCSIDAICDLFAGALDLRSSDWHADEEGFCGLGVVKGEKRCQMVGVQSDAEGLFLVVASSVVPLGVLMGFENGRFSFDAKMVRQMVDSSTSADERYTPSTIKRENRKLATAKMYESWRKEHRRLQKEHPQMSQSWYANKIAKMKIAQGKSSETIRKNLKG